MNKNISIASAAVIILIISVFLLPYGVGTNSFYELHKITYGNSYITYLFLFLFLYFILQLFNKKKLSLIGFIGCFAPFIIDFNSMWGFSASQWSLGFYFYLLALILMLAAAFI